MAHSSEKEDILREISQGKYKNIIVLSGAGVSVSAGIPSYRSRDGLFTDLEASYKMPAEKLFTKKYIPLLGKGDDICPIYNKFLTSVKEAVPTPHHLWVKNLAEKVI